MNNTKHPSFILGIISIIVLAFGIGMKANGYRSGDYVVLGSVVLAGIHWIWSVIEVAGRTDLKPFQKRFWLIAVIAAPVFGGMLFHILHQRPGRITT